MSFSPVAYLPWPAMLVRQDSLEIIEANKAAADLANIKENKLPGKDGSVFFPETELGPGEFEGIPFQSPLGLRHTIDMAVYPFNKKDLACYIISFRKRFCQFQELLDGVADGIIITDKKLNILDVNPALCAITELKRGDLLGKNGFNIARKYTKGQSLKKILLALKKMAAGQTVHKFEVDYSGKRLELSTSIRKDSSSYIGILRDISKEKEVQKALSESEEKFRFFAESSIEGIVIHKQGIVVDANKSFLKMTGYSRSEAIGKNLLDYIPKKREKALVRANMLKPRSTPYHIQAQKKDGSLFIVELESQDANYQDENIRLTAVRDVSAQIELQEKLRESEERYRTIFEKTATATVIIDEDKTISLANSTFASLVGYSKAEIENKMSWVNFVVPEDLEEMKMWHDLRRKNLQKTPTSYEFKLIDRHGNIKHISLFVDIIDGSMQSIASLLDITKRKKAEIQIIENETRLKKAQSIANMGNWSMNLDTGQVSGSEETKRIYGLTGTQLSLENTQEIHLPEYREMLERKLNDLVSGQGSYDVEFRLKNQDSGKITDVRSIAEYNPDSNTVTGIIQDISRMKEAEKQILQNEKYLKSILRAAPVGIGVLVNRKFTGVNENLCELTGYTEKELLNQSARILYLSDQDFNYVGEIKYRDIGLFGSGTLETRWKCKDGSIRDILLSSTPIDSEDLQKGVTFTALDITERKQAEQDLLSKNHELKLARDKAEESDHLKSAFLANMSHEIRTPMNGILGFTNLLENPSLSSETMHSYIEIIKKSGERLMDTVNDLIDISKIETGQVDIIVEDTFINDLLDTIYLFFSQETKDKGIHLSCLKAFPKQQVCIRTDEKKLNSILTNLVKNAIKFTHQGLVEFGYTIIDERNRKMLRFYIKDSGIGIPENRHEAIFNRFEQADIGDRNAYEGSGLGLSISKSLVEMLGGKIWLESEVDIGSTFFFTIPYIVSEGLAPASIESKPAEVKSKEAQRLKILIAEDDVASYLHLSILLKEMSREIIHVSSGKEAVSTVMNNPDIDLVLMDIKMPGMNGLEATRKIREFSSSIPIIAQTAYALPGDLELALEAGCNDYITKPIIGDVFLEKIALNISHGKK